MSDFEIQIVQSWGIASARHTSGCTVSLPSRATTHDTATEFLFDAPLGPSIVRWDIVNQTQVLQFQAHRDLVTCMRASPDRQLVATSCYSGGVRLWSVGWECVGDVTAPMASQHHVSHTCTKLHLMVSLDMDHLGQCVFVVLATIWYVNDIASCGLFWRPRNSSYQCLTN